MDSLKGTLTPMKVLQGTLNGGIAYGTFNYNELENKPSINGTELVGNVTVNIPTKTSDLTNDSGFITNADVPTKTSELTNDSGFITSADIPTKTSELTNDSGFITSEDIPTIPTNTSQLNNDSGFLTMLTTPVRSVNSQTGDVSLFIPNATSQLTNDAGFITANSNVITDIEDDITTLQGDVETNTQAIEDIQTPVIGTPYNGAITAGENCTVRAANIIKINHIVVFTAYINFTTPITSRKTIATIASQFRPSGQNVTFITGGSNAINSLQNRMTNGIITTTGDVIVGDIIVPASESIKEVMISTVYYS